MNDTLTLALEHSANDLRDIFSDLYPDAPIRRSRTRAVWRGGDGLNVGVYRRSLRDFVSGETYGVWRFLTEIAGFSKAQAAEYLLGRAGLVSGAQTTPEAQRRAAVKSRHREAAEKRLGAYRTKCLAQALELQKTAPTTGTSGYLNRKGIAGLFDSYRVAPAFIDDQMVPGLVFSSDQYGPFVQLVLRDVTGKIVGYQRIYDGERGKQFVAGTKPTGAFVLLEPTDKYLQKHFGKATPRFKDLPKSRIAEDLEAGYELAICEGLATGASVALARPQSFVFCALSAGNLAPVAEALRTAYGYTAKLETPRGDKRKAIDLTIWGDFDKSQTGQRAAHGAALASGCYVRLPRFKKGYGDFNDLHQGRGLEAVKRTRRVTPDVTQAFAKELGKQKLSPDKHLAPFALPDAGAGLIVRAPQETGKTHRLAELLAGQGLRVLVVTHRESLAKNLAARLEFESYQDYSAYLLRDIPRLVICFDSLQKLELNGQLPSYDLLVLDESEQVLAHTTGRHIKRKAQNFGVFEHYLKTAPRIICADANAGELTANALKCYSPERRVAWHIHEHHVGRGRKLRLTFDRDDVLDVLEAETRPVWCASDSMRHTRDLSAYLNDPHTLTINSETSATEAAAAYLLDPTGQAPAHRRMIASPSVQTGVSDDSGHWQHVAGSFSGYSSTPQDAMQAAMRARRVPELTIYAARGRGAALTVQEALDGAAAADDFEAKGLKRDTYGDQNKNYGQLRAEVVSQRSRRQAGYKSGFALEAARLGYSIAFDVARDLTPGEVLTRDKRRAALKEAGLERYVSDRLGAERIDEARAKAYDEAYSLSQDKFFALEQYQLRAFYRLPDDVPDEQLANMLREDEYKALRDKVMRYENFVEPREVAEARAQGDLEGGMLKGDAKQHLLRFEYHQQLGKVVGLDAATEARAETWEREINLLRDELEALRAKAKDANTRRKGELNRDIAKLEAVLAARLAESVGPRYSAGDAPVKAFVAWCVNHYQALKHAGLVTAALDNLKVKPLETIGDSLRRCGLEQTGDSKRAGKSYAVQLLGVLGMWNYSRHRRENWQSAQQTNIKTLDNHLLRKNAFLASGTGLITDVQNPKPHDAPLGWLGEFTGWLEAGKLDGFGPQKLRSVRAKLEERDHTWVYRFAASREVYKMVGRL